MKDLLGGIGWGVKQIPSLYFESFDEEGLPPVPAGLKAKNCAQVGKGCKAIKDYILEECNDGNFPLILGGDHCIAIGTISAIKEARKDAGIVWVSSWLCNI